MVSQPATTAAKCAPKLLTKLAAHKVVNHGVDGAVEVAQPMGDESSGNRVIVLRQFDCVSENAD